MLSLSQYARWSCFRFSGKRFLALYDSEGCHVVGESFENYGKWRSQDSFVSRYKKLGEMLCLNK